MFLQIDQQQEEGQCESPSLIGCKGEYSTKDDEKDDVFNACLPQSLIARPVISRVVSP